MIFVKGYGQMCNNWLQYAHIYAWGREYGVRTVSMRFAYKYRYFHICETPWHNPATYLAAKLLIKTRLIRCLWLQHPRQRTDPEVHRLLSRSPLIAADGWSFRHPQLFMKYRAEIASLFAFRPAKVAAKAAWLRSLPGADVRLGLHIRRGDYARWQGGAYFFADDEYAERVRQFAALFPGKRVQVLVATNDPRVDLGLLRSRSGVADMHLTRATQAKTSTCSQSATTSWGRRAPSRSWPRSTTTARSTGWTARAGNSPKAASAALPMCSWMCELQGVL